MKTTGVQRSFLTTSTVTYPCCKQQPLGQCKQAAHVQSLYYVPFTMSAIDTRGITLPT